MDESEKDAIKALYRRWLFELWHGAFSVAEEILAPDFVGHWPHFDVHGPNEMLGQIRRSHDYFSDIEIDLDVGPIVENDLLAARWTLHGAYQEGIPGAAAPPGTRIAMSGMDVFRASRGRFAEYWVVSDGLGLMAALGALREH